MERSFILVANASVLWFVWALVSTAAVAQQGHRPCLPIERHDWSADIIPCYPTSCSSYQSIPLPPNRSAVAVGLWWCQQARTAVAVMA